MYANSFYEPHPVFFHVTKTAPPVRTLSVPLTFGNFWNSWSPTVVWNQIPCIHTSQRRQQIPWPYRCSPCSLILSTVVLPVALKEVYITPIYKSGDRHSPASYRPIIRIRSDQIRSDQIRSDQIRSDQIRSDQIRSDQIRSDQIRSDQIRSDQGVQDKAARQKFQILTQRAWVPTVLRLCLSNRYSDTLEDLKQVKAETSEKWYRPLVSEPKEKLVGNSGHASEKKGKEDGKIRIKFWGNSDANGIPCKIPERLIKKEILTHFRGVSWSLIRNTVSNLDDPEPPTCYFLRTA